MDESIRKERQIVQHTFSQKEEKTFRSLTKTLDREQLSHSTNLQITEMEGGHLDVQVSQTARYTMTQNNAMILAAGSDKERDKRRKEQRVYEAHVKKEVEQEKEKLLRREAAVLEKGKTMLQQAPNGASFLPPSNYGAVSRKLTLGILNNQMADETDRFSLYERARTLEMYATAATDQLQLANYNATVLLPKLDGENAHLRKYLKEERKKAQEAYNELAEKIEALKNDCQAKGIASADDDALAAFDQSVAQLAEEKKLSASQAQVERSHFLLRQSRPKTMQKREEHINKLRQKGRMLPEGKIDRLEALEIYQRNMERVSQQSVQLIYETELRIWREAGSVKEKEPKKMEPLPGAVMELWVSEYLKAVVENSYFCTRQPGKWVFDAILDGGRFLNQLETGSSSAAYTPENRMEFTEMKFGVNRDDLQAQDYERYGYVGTQSIGKMAQSHLSHYGDVEFVLKKDKLMERTTTTVGDSLCIKETAQASRVFDPQLYSCSGGGYGAFEARLVALAYQYKKKKEENPNHVPDVEDMISTKIGEKDVSLTTLQYMELQYHGELTMEDVSEIRVLVDIAHHVKGVRVNEADAIEMTKKLKAFNEQRKKEGKPAIKLTLVREKKDYEPKDGDTPDDAYQVETPDVSAD